MSQCAAILAHLEAGNTITPLEALQLCGSLRLSERIREIEAQDVPIEHEMVSVGGKHVCRYKLGGIAYG